jgi:hypothetical protein
MQDLRDSLEIQMDDMHDDLKSYELLIRKLDTPLAVGWNVGLSEATKK